MLKSLCILFGIIFVGIGALGFVPGVTQDGHLFGVFHVNTFHNWVHLLTGVVALICGATSAHASKFFFRIFGVVYGLVAVLGFVSGDQPILGVLANNMADVWLHVGIAVVSLALGFGLRETHERMTPRPA